MRFLEFCQVIEGAIDTSTVTNEADGALTAAFLEIIHKQAKDEIYNYDYDQKKSNPQYTPDEDAESREKEIIEHLKNKFSNSRGSGAYQCVYKGSDILTSIVQKNILSQFGVNLAQDGKNDGVLIDQQYYPIQNVKVIIKHGHGGEDLSKEGGSMNRRSSANYFGLHSDKIDPNYPFYSGLSINLHDTGMWRESFEEGVIASISMSLGGQYLDYEPEYYVDMMVDQILEVFSHEFDHLIYYLKKSKSTPNLSSISHFKNKEGTRGYDNHINWDDPNDIRRYFGSEIELQAWATGEATNLIRKLVTVQRRNYSAYKQKDRDINDPKIWNQEVDKLINMVKTQNVKYSTHSFEYQDEIRKKISDAGGDKQAYTKVWQKYLKLLVAKLEAYKK